jgi:hypothetical protein
MMMSIGGCVWEWTFARVNYPITDTCCSMPRLYTVAITCEAGKESNVPAAAGLGKHAVWQCGGY